MIGAVNDSVVTVLCYIQKRTCITAKIAVTQVRCILCQIKGGLWVQGASHNIPMKNLDFF